MGTIEQLKEVLIPMLTAELESNISKLNLDQIENLSLAVFLADFYRKHPRYAVQSLQSLLLIPQTGVIDAATIDAINACADAEVFESYKAVRISYVKGLLSRYPQELQEELEYIDTFVYAE